MRYSVHYERIRGGRTGLLPSSFGIDAKNLREAKADAGRWEECRNNSEFGGNVKIINVVLIKRIRG